MFKDRQVIEALRRVEDLLAEGQAWRLVAQDLMRQNRELHDRLMARSLEEHKTYTLVDEGPREKPPYDVSRDEDAIGLILEVPQ